MADDSLSSRNVIVVTATSRPKRVAFLLDPQGVTAADVEVVTQHSIERWGGGYYPIIPTDGTDVAPDYWRLLKAIDPDVVYAITRIEDELARQLHLSIAPAIIEGFDERRRHDGRLWIDGGHTSALGVLDIPESLVASQRSPFPHRFIYFKHATGQEPSRDFALRNFGLTVDVVSTKQAFEGLPLEQVDLDKTDVESLLTSLSGLHGCRITTPHDLSVSFMHPPYRLKHDGFAESFHLVVGDSIDDLLYAWNRQFMSPRWKGQDLLWLPNSLVDNGSLLEVVGKWISHSYWDSQQKRGYVVSYSADEALLRRIATSVGKAAFMPFEIRKLQGNQFPLPETEPAYFGVLDDPPPRSNQQIALHNDRGLLSIPVPGFVTNRRSAGNEGWMVDLDVEYHLDPVRYTNRADQWRLPKRALLGREFAELDGSLLARVVEGGLPSVEVRPRDQNIRLKAPSKRSVFFHLLQPAGALEAGPTGDRRDFGTSTQGESLSGMIGLFGSLEASGWLFDDLYWRNVLLGLAGLTDSHTRAQVTRVQNLLKKSNDEGGGIAVDGDRQALANRIVEKVGYFAGPTPSISWDDLRSRFAQVKASDAGEKDTVRGESFDDFTARQARGLIEEGILVQGVLLDCPHCGTKNWRLVDALSSELKCDGCLLSFPFTPTAGWLFRLNSLIGNGITKGGVLAVLHALFLKAQFAREFFCYLPCQDVYEPAGNGEYVKATDLDLIAVKDGEFLIGEVKSSPEGFLDFNFERLRSLALDIRPALVVLAATGTVWPEPVNQKMSELNEALGAVGVRLEALLMNW